VTGARRLARVAVLLATAGCGRVGFEERATDATPSDVPGMSPEMCPALPVVGPTMRVTNISELEAALTSAPAGTTLLLADGTYPTSERLLIDRPLVLRSESGDADGVVIDGLNVAVPLVYVRASNTSILSLTVANAVADGISIEPTSAGDITNVLVYDVTIRDSRGPAVRMRPFAAQQAGPFADMGTVACSRVVTANIPTVCSTSTVTWGVDADASRGWTIRNNLFDRRACTMPGFRTIWIDSGSRDIEVIGNTLLNTNYGIIFGGTASTRTYADPLPTDCTGTPELISGTICNNVIASPAAPAQSGEEDFSEGIALWRACDAWVMHNTIVSPDAAETFSNVEYRFPESYVHLVNNLTRVPVLARDSGREDPAFASSNKVLGSLNELEDVPSGNARLVPGAQVPPGASIATLGRCATDLDGKLRNLTSPTPGAFER
jgi:hypothetical protein